MPEHVLIIGAGIGGLALAHGLKKAGISFHIYERDPAAQYRPQGYRVRISPDGAEALHAVLTPDHFRLFELACANPPSMGINIDAITGKQAVVSHKPMIPRPTSKNFSSYTADRMATRAVLLQGLEAEISFAKELVSFEITPEQATAHFKDGSQASGTLLVGAEGVRSPVRRQHFPTDLAPVDTEARAIFGKTIFTPTIEAELREELLNKTCLIQDRSRSHVLTLFTEGIHFDRTNGVEHPADYIYWVLVGRKSVFDEAGIADVAHLSKDDASAAALQITNNWDTQIRSIIVNQDLGQTSGLRICSTVPGRLHWTSSERITALGDAIHVAPPAGGQGANMALRDAAALTKALAEGGSDDGEGKSKSLAERIQGYEADMRAAVAPALEASLGGGKWMFDQKPYEECMVAEF